MILNVVAYPNSKDFLILQALYRLFGIPWYEADVVDQTDMTVSEEEAAGGFRSAGMPWRMFYDKHNTLPSFFAFARTRQLPVDDLPFLYVSRNPVSIFMEAAAKQDSQGVVTLEHLVQESLGIGHLPDWSAHYHLWKEQGAKATSHFVRVEDFCADPLRTLVRIAVRLSLPKPQALQNYGCQLPPNGFEEFGTADEVGKRFVLALHGKVMKEVGYGEPIPDPDSEQLDSLPSDFLAKALKLLRDESNSSKEKAAKVQTMASYINSLENQYKQETEALLSRIKKLSEGNR